MIGKFLCGIGWHRFRLDHYTRKGLAISGMVHVFTRCGKTEEVDA